MEYEISAQCQRKVRTGFYPYLRLMGWATTAVLLTLIGCSSPAPKNDGWVYFPQKLSGVDGEVFALAAYDSLLYAGGEFWNAGAVAARNIACWDGHVWSALGTGVGNRVELIAVDRKGAVYVCNRSQKPTIEKWDGTVWRMIADSISGIIDAMYIDAANNVLISGTLTKIQGIAVDTAARWNGTAWSRLDAPGPLLVNARGEVYAYRYDRDEGTMQAYQFRDSLWDELGSTLPWGGSRRDYILTGFDGAQRMMVACRQTVDGGEGEQTSIFRLENSGEWTTASLARSFWKMSFLQPDKLQPSTIWIEGEGCLYRLENDSLKDAEYCNVGTILAQTKNGQIYTAGGKVYTRESQAYIARMGNNTWVGVDSTGVDLFKQLPSRSQLTGDLLRQIPEKGRSPYLVGNNVDDIVPDGNGGLFLAFDFDFEEKGTFLRRLAYWKDGVYSSLGGGLYRSGYGEIALALAPDGTLYAANAALTQSSSNRLEGLYRFDGKVWHFVRTTPFVVDMVFDRYGTLYGLTAIRNSGTYSFCRIPIEFPKDSIETIPVNFKGHAYYLTVDDTLVHLFGDFVSVNDSLSLGHVGWRIPNRGKPMVSRAPTALSNEDRIRVLPEYQERISLLDSSQVMQSAEYSLYATTAIPSDTVYLQMRHIDNLQMQSYSERRSWYDIPSEEYTVSSREDGFLVKVCLPDSVTAKGNIPLKVTTIRTGLISKVPPDGYRFRDTLHPLVANLYDNGTDDKRSIHIGVGDNFPVQGRIRPKDTLVQAAAFPLPLEWTVHPDPDRLTDPFFSLPEHKSRWYAHLLSPSSGDDSSTMAENPLPPGISRETLIRDLWKRPIIPSDSEVEIGCSFYAGQWESQNVPTFLVFFETAVYYRHQSIESKRMLRIGMYRQGSDSTLALVAEAEPIEFEDQEQIQNLDFAPYRLSEREFAFGIRWYRNIPYAGGGGSSESLTLFRVEDSVISPILQTLMSSSSMTAGEWYEDGSREHFDNDGGTAIISVSKSKTGGFFDLNKVSDDKSAVFKWNGEQYELQGEDPVTEVNVY